MNARQLKNCMRQYVEDCKKTDPFKNMKQFIYELESEEGEAEAG